MKGKEVKVAARPSVLGSQLKTLAEQPAIQAKQVAAETQNIVEKAGRAAKSVAGTVQSEIDSAILTAPARKRMIEAVRDGLNMWKPQAKFTDLTIMAVSATAFSVWLASAKVMLVLGKGPVPSFAPPYVPVGPVVGGDILSVPGHLSAAPPLTVLP